MNKSFFQVIIPGAQQRWRGRFRISIFFVVGDAVIRRNLHIQRNYQEKCFIFLIFILNRNQKYVNIVET